MFSMLLHPSAHGVPVTRQGWLPLLTGLAVVSAIRRTTARARTGRFGDGEAVEGQALDAVLKWPNDVLVGDRKLGGILAERADDAVVMGVGLNVSLREAELPVPTATSLAVENAAFTDREPLLRAVLRQIEEWYTAWCMVEGNPDADPPGGYPAVSGVAVSETLEGGLRKAYKNVCATLGREVRVELPGDKAVTGLATDIDEAGRLVVGGQAHSAGDVVHVR
jgi:BirA family biotin operon repressor/biotin-[acetyl-CoA-carboxylase] ligase